jgi:hypothetical protein
VALSIMLAFLVARPQGLLGTAKVTYVVLAAL